MDDNIFTVRGQLSEISGVDFNVFDIVLNDFIIPDIYCKTCNNNCCDFKEIHRHGFYEASRWGGVYVYFCPCSLCFIALYFPDLPVKNNYGILGGPVIIKDSDEDLGEGLPKLSAHQVKSLSDIALNLFSTGWEYDTAKSIDKMLNNAYSIAYETGYKFTYPFEIEKDLSDAMSRGDIQSVREHLNNLLGHIYFNSGNNFTSLKVRVTELIVLLSRAAVNGGADAERIFMLNDKYISDVEKYKTIESLSLRLTDIINTFVGYIFEYSNVKHVEVVYKITTFINQNYNKKITLDDVANHVFMSRSYISRIFKKETGISLAEYINKVRVEKSKLLLSDMSLSLSNISDYVGFSDQSYFTKIFKNQTGVSPGKYREKNIK